MSAHLTQEELTDKLLGLSSLTVNAHLLSCPACADDLERLKTSITCFRSAATAWSDSALARANPNATLVPSRRQFWPAANWIIATAAMIVLIAVSAIHFHKQEIGREARSNQIATPSTTIETAQTQIERDDELLAQVNSELGEAVPAPMQPLRISGSVASSNLQPSSSGKRN